MEQTRETSSACTLCQYLNESPSTKELLDNLQDPTQLSRRLRQLPLSKRLACVVGLILRATKVPSKVGLLTSLPETQVLDVMEETRELLEGARDCTFCTAGPEEMAHLLRRLLIKLSRNTQMVPRSFLIRGVQLQDRDPVSCGGFADIFKASYRGQLVALKKPRHSKNNPVSESEVNEFRREALVSWFLSHPNIQPFLGVDQATFYPLLCIVSIWQQNGNILDWLKYFKALGLPILADECIKRILSGVCYLHKNGITHGDLSSKNLLIDGHCNPKLADFGLSTLHGAGSSTMGSRSSGGTMRFMAPEILGGSSQSSFAADMYAFGCVCIELHTLQHPFPTLNDFQVMFAVAQGARPSKPSEPTNSLDGFWEAISQCWNNDPHTRPLADSLASSLPLQTPALPAPDSAALPHVNWKMPTPKFPRSPASDGPSAEYHLHQDPTRTLDSCLIGLLDFSTPHGKNVHEMLEQLAALGCPEEVTRFVREGLADKEAADTGPHSQMETSGATLEGKQVDTYPTITTSLDLGERAPARSAVERTAGRAKSLYDIGLRLRDVGRHKEALDCFLQAIEIQRELATANADEFRPPLAFFLDNASYCFDQLGDLKDAVKYSLEAVSLRRDLARKKPDGFNELLSLSLHDLISYLHKLGEWTDAVVYGQQLADLYRFLAREKPDEFNVPLALSLHNLAFHLSELGGWNGALNYGRQAVDLRQNLAREKPDLFNSSLALSLDNLAFYLSNLGEWKDAVVYGQQVADLYRDLAREDPNNFNLRLAKSLHHLARYSYFLGEWKDAVVYGRQVVELYQDLSRENPNEFNELFALLFHDLASYLSELKEWKDAVIYARQAVNLRRDLAQEKPDTFNSPFSQSLDRLGNSLAHLGEWKDAVIYGRQAVDLRRDLAREKPDAFNIPLAQSLHNFAFYLSKQGEWKDAVVYGRQAVGLYRNLSQQNPNAFDAPLGLSLYNLAVDISRVGEWKDAMVHGGQAADLHRDLAQKNPDEFNAHLALSLAHLARSSEKLGRHEDVVDFGHEAAAVFRSPPHDQPQWVRPEFLLVLGLLGPSLVILGFVDEAVEVDQEAKRLEQNPESVS